MGNIMNEFLSILLNEIELKMVAIRTGDIEANHAIADEYLVTIIKNLATDENREQLTRILEAYEQVEKGYA
jgi:hypothetical protein